MGEDRAVVTGLGRFRDRPVAVIGQQKGADTKDNYSAKLRHDDSRRLPEGAPPYEDGGEVRMPVIIFIDTPGAYPGIGAEERGQGEAIGRNIMEIRSADADHLAP